MLKRSSILDKIALEDMIKGAQPRVLVVVNRSVPKWVEPIRRLDGLVYVAEVFRSGRNQHILRVDGDYPKGNDDDSVVSSCKLDSMLPRLLRIDSPAALGVAHGEQVAIDFEGGLTIWARIDISDAVWLTPQGWNPLSGNQEYLIVRNSDGRLSFVKV